LSKETISEVVRLFEEKYSDTNFCHYAELLGEHEGIRLSPSSVGRILKSAGKKSKKSVKRRMFDLERGYFLRRISPLLADIFSDD
jgi:transposase